MSFYGVVVNSCLHTLFLFGYPFLPLFFSSPPSLPSLCYFTVTAFFWKCSNWLTFSFLVVIGSAPFLCVHCFCLNSQYNLSFYPLPASLLFFTPFLPWPLFVSLYSIVTVTIATSISACPATRHNSETGSYNMHTIAIDTHTHKGTWCVCIIIIFTYMFTLKEPLCLSEGCQ